MDLSLLCCQQRKGAKALPGHHIRLSSSVHRLVATQINGITGVPFERIEEPHDI
jgi:hypothetical protein